MRAVTKSNYLAYDADHKMVKSLDAISWKKRKWEHAIARNAIAAKAKLGMRIAKNGKSCRGKKACRKD